MLRFGVPYRIDVHDAAGDTFDRLVDLGALDIEPIGGGVAAIMPNDVDVARVASVLGHDDVRVSPARGRDGDSVWVLRPRPVRIGRFLIGPAEWPDPIDGVRLVDDPAFGTGLHATTALCLEALDAELDAARPVRVLDVGTGSGVLALAALWTGVPAAVAIDIDADAVAATTANAQLNGLMSRLQVVHSGPEAIAGTWPFVVANILTAALMEMAPTLSQRIGSGGRLVLSGVRASLAADVRRAYRHVGLRQIDTRTRDGWAALTLQASW
jgi:ribosomal protein L11 methyltransferase